MKFDKNQLDVLKANIDGFLKSSGKTETEWLMIYKKNGHSVTRFAFDLFYATGLKIGDGVGLTAKAGKYDTRTVTIPDCSDKHIVTAVCKCLENDIKKTLKA